MRTLLLLLGSLLVAIVHAAEPGTPASLESWRAWVLKDQEFRACPLIAGGNAGLRDGFVCQWPGQLDINANAEGARFVQRWHVEAEGWIPLPGDREHWPLQVLVDGQAAAVVDHDGPNLWLGSGNHEVRGRIIWNERPQSLQVPQSVALVALEIDGKPVVPPQREGDQLTLGRGAATAIEADSLEMRVYRKFVDDLPGELTTQVQLFVSGQAREEVIGPALPSGFLPMVLDSEQWPARLDDEGRLHVQVQPGSNTLTLTARALAPVSVLTAMLPEHWAHQEIWSYESMPVLRVTGVSGGVQVDPRQANVPNEWSGLPAFAMDDGAKLTIEQRSRGIAAEEANRLVLQREAWLDFSGKGWFARDRISGQMNSGWRFDVAAPFSLQRAQGSNAYERDDALLITNGTKPGLSGVEWRTPSVDLRAGLRIEDNRGTLPIAGWQQVFDQVTTTLHLPYGYRLIAAPGSDRASGSWLSGWTLLDVFLAAMLVLLAVRLLGRIGGMVAMLYLLLSYQESGAPLWTLLAVLALALIARALPAGRLARVANGLRVLAMAMLLLAALPFAGGQLRQAIYPQLETGPAYSVGLGIGTGSGVRLNAERSAMQEQDQAADMPSMAIRAPASAPPESKARMNEPSANERLDTIVVTGSNIRRADLMSKYSQNTVVQTGAGEPGWQIGSRYVLNWSGPVLPTQDVHLIIASPWLVRLLRVALVALLGLLLWRIASSAPWRWRTGTKGAASGMAILCVSMLAAPAAHAADYPPDSLLQQLRDRLLEAPACLPHCADVAQAQVSARGDELRVVLEIHALTKIAVPLPMDDKALVLRSITLDGASSATLVRIQNKPWIQVSRGVHRVELVFATAADRIALAFAMPPARVLFDGREWQASGLVDDRLLTETLSMARSRAAPGQPELATAQRFPPYVRVTRNLHLDLEWTTENRVFRLAPEKGGFAVSVPILEGEHVVTPGLKVRDGKVTVALADAARDATWNSNLDQAESLTLTAPDLPDHAEVWTVVVSPTWHVEFSGVPESVQQTTGDSNDDYHEFEFHPLPGEKLSLRIHRPAASAGATRAIDRLSLSSEFGLRAQAHVLQFDLRASQGGEQAISLPATAELIALTRDGTPLGVRPIDGRLSVPVNPGTQHYEVRFRENVPVGFSLSTPLVDLGLPAANINLVATLPNDRWLLAAFGPPVGPAVLFWGELLVAIALAWLLSRWHRGTLRFHYWLLLVLGFSTFSWLALVVVVAWLFALDWRARNAPEANWKFNLVQLGLAALSLIALVCLFESISNGLLGSPDMVVRGNGSYGNQLQWFADRCVDTLPTASVISLPLWVYNVVMLFWALWLAWAVVGWLRRGFAAWTSGGYWRPWRIAPAEPTIDVPPAPPPSI